MDFSHGCVSLNWAVNSTETLDTIFQNQTAFDAVQAEWTETKTGPLSASGGTNLIEWSRALFKDSSFSCWLTRDAGAPLGELGGAQDPSSGPLSPHMEIIFTHGAGTPLEPPPTS